MLHVASTFVIAFAAILALCMFVASRRRDACAPMSAFPCHANRFIFELTSQMVHGVLS